MSYCGLFWVMVWVGEDFKCVCVCRERGNESKRAVSKGCYGAHYTPVKPDQTKASPPASSQSSSKVMFIYRQRVQVEVYQDGSQEDNMAFRTCRHRQSYMSPTEGGTSMGSWQIRGSERGMSSAAEEVASS